MNKKVTRRAVLGTVVAGLAAGPFVISWLRRRRQIELPSFLADMFWARFGPELSFPRKFDIEHYEARQWTPMSTDGPYDAKKAHREALERFYALPKSTRDTIVETQRRYWHNFAQIDEIEFDCTHFDYNKDGTKRTYWMCFEGHVKLRYGHGLTVVGKDVEGKPIHWVLDLASVISGTAWKFNLSAITLDFFSAYKAKPTEVLSFDHVYSTDAELPDNSYLQAVEGDRYTILSADRYLESIELPPHIEGKVFHKTYYNNKTGMVDYLCYRTFDPDSEGQGVIKWRRDADGRIVMGEGDRYLNPKYADPSVLLPEWGGGTEYWKNVEVGQGIFLPTEYAKFFSPSGSHTDDILLQQSTYSNIRVKRV